MRSSILALIFVGLIGSVFADLYLHNNNDGGYDNHEGDASPGAPKTMKYFVGSELTVEWAVQHSCGRHSNVHCQMVLQYMCSDEMRDGTSEDRVNYNRQNPAASDNTARGMHENWYHFYSCESHRRNVYLFLADRTLNQNDARVTRQNNNANNDNERRGLECQEERDYYPYWQPSPWKDIAVLTGEPEVRCDHYWQNTGNTNPKYHCLSTINAEGASVKAVKEQLTEGECTADNGVWTKIDPHFHDRTAVEAQSGAATAVANPNVPFWGAGDPAQRVECIEFRRQAAQGDITSEQAELMCKRMLGGPNCLETQWSRDNHLGVVRGGYFMNYTWRIPDDVNQKCAFRIRYNMSSDDYPYWVTNSGQNGEINSPILQNPFVNFNWAYPLQLAIDTDQFGRTFQDRSHIFEIAARPQSVVAGARIININVRGKRGAITQTYPSPGYDFVPKEVHAAVGDYVHFQWAGGSHLPNDEVNGRPGGGGRNRTERHNVVEIASMTDSWPKDPATATFFTEAEKTHFAMAGQELLDSSQCSSMAALKLQYNFIENPTPGDRDQWLQNYEVMRKIRADISNCMYLNRAPALFWSEPKQLTAAGSFYYMSTRDTIPGRQGMKGAIHVQ